MRPWQKKSTLLGGEPYTFIKQLDKYGKVTTTILDPKGQAIDEQDLPPADLPEIVDIRVIKWIEQAHQSGQLSATLPVVVAVNLPEPKGYEEEEVGEGLVLYGEQVKGHVNGQEMDEKTLQDYANKQAKRQLARLQEMAEYRRHLLEEWAGQHNLQGAEGFEQSVSQGSASLTLSLNASQLLQLIEARDKQIVGIELAEKSEDDINSAMNDTNVTHWAHPFSATRGDDIGIYMTESGCAKQKRISRYNRLSGSETNHSRNVGAIIRAVSPEAYLYCRGGAVLPKNSDLNGVWGKPPIYIITRSNSSNDSTSYNTLDRDWDNYAYDNLLAIFNSGGNTGSGTGNVRSPGKGLNLTTVANYNDASNSVSGTSPFVDPQTGNEKPELAAPGVNITAGGFTMSGTSMSTPHAAAFTADMMSSSTYLKYRPYLAKAKLLAGATDAISGGADKVGLGGIDFLSAQWSGYWSWWSGSNSAWSSFDSDGDGYITRTVYISSHWNNVRVALAWMNRGSYTYSHRADAHPIGMDLDLRVYSPSGSYIGSSLSWDNPYESVEFTPTTSGYYTFKINRYANRDTSSALRMGLYVNYH